MEKEKKENWLMAGVAYLAFVVPLFSEKAKKDDFVKYHVRQAVAFVICVLAVQGAISIWGYWMLPGRILLIYALRALYLVGMMWGFINAYNGVKKPLPYIGKYAERF